MPFEFYSDQPSTTGGAAERVLIKNDTSSTINLLTTDENGNIQYTIPISAGGSTLHRTISGSPNAIERPNGDRFWFYNSEKGTIVVSDLGKEFKPYNEEKDKDAFLFDFEKDLNNERNVGPDKIGTGDGIDFVDGLQDWKTDGNGFATDFRITNNSDSVITLYWYDRSGELIPYATLSPGQKHIQSTFTEHPWYVVSEDKKMEISFYPSDVGTITMGESRAEFIPYVDGDFPLRHLTQFKFVEPVGETIDYLHTVGSLFSNFYGYGVPSAAKALGVPENAIALTETSKNNHDQINLLDAHHAWAAGFTGSGVIVAVVDGGFHPHDELNFEFSLDLDSGQPNVTPEDGYYHGNGVASAIAAKYEPDKQGPDITGIAPDVSLMAIDITRIGGQSIPNAFTQGIRYAVNNGANIIQISWGNTGDTYSPDLASAVQYAYDNDVLVVWAAMNRAHYGLEGMSKTAELGIAIAGGNMNMNFLKPFPSSNLAGDKLSSFFITPSGNNFVPTEGDRYTATADGGTSYASPLISGIAALLYQQNPNITVDEVIKKLALSSWQPSLGKNAEINELGQQILTPQTIGTASLRSPITDVLQFDTTKSEIFPTKVSRGSGFTTFDGKSISLLDVERLQFTDAKIAFDTDGKAGDALELLYAVSKDQYLNNDGVKGLAIELIDKAANRNEVVDYVMGELAGPSWNLNDMTKILARNIYGIEVTGAIDNLITDLMQANQWDNYDFFWAVAESETASSVIGLVGLSDSGITYS
jgi:subtilisin family serine protease